MIILYLIFLPSDFFYIVFVTFVDMVSVIFVGTIFDKFVDELSVAFITSLHTLTKVSAILFKYLLGFQP